MLNRLGTIAINAIGFFVLFVPYSALYFQDVFLIYFTYFTYGILGCAAFVYMVVSIHCSREAAKIVNAEIRQNTNFISSIPALITLGAAVFSVYKLEYAMAMILVLPTWIMVLSKRILSYKAMLPK